jgi:single stranded DNA-binding protein (ssb)
MNGVNKVILLGNIGKDPDIVVFDGIKKASFSLATTEIFRNKEGEKNEQTEWHTVVCWRSLADITEKFLRKGSPIYVEGKLHTRTWEDKEGNKRHTTEIVADNIIILSRTYCANNEYLDSSSDLSDILDKNPELESSQDLPF